MNERQQPDRVGSLTHGFFVKKGTDGQYKQHRMELAAQVKQ